MNIKKPLISLLSVILFASGAFAAKKDAIAVTDFVPRNTGSDSASTVSDLFRSELVKTGKYDVLDRGNMDKIIKEYELQASGITNVDDAVKLGNVLNVAQMTYGTFSKMDGAYFISVQVVNIETGKILYSENEKFYKLNESDIAVRRIVQKITDQKIKGADEKYSVPVSGKQKVDDVLNGMIKKWGTPSDKRTKIEILGNFYEYDDILEDYYIFLLVRSFDIPTKKYEYRIVSNNLITIMMKQESAVEKSKKAFDEGKEFIDIMTVFSAPEGDPRKVEYRLYQKNGKPSAVEIYFVGRNADWTGKKPKKFRWLFDGK